MVATVAKTNTADAEDLIHKVLDDIRRAEKGIRKLAKLESLPRGSSYALKAGLDRLEDAVREFYLSRDPFMR